MNVEKRSGVVDASAFAERAALRLPSTAGGRSARTSPSIDEAKGGGLCHIKLSGPVRIGGEWIELKPEESLRAEKTFQNVVLELEPPLKYDLMREGNGPEAGKGILMPDGEVINPEIEVIDQYGNKFGFVWSGATGAAPSPTYSLPHPKELPRDREYRAVRIRSPKPIRCKAVYWFNESSKDWM